jgi:Recombinase/Recombinase zinc beta ribbon domain
VRVEEAEAAVVRELFAQYLEPGGSLAGLAKHLYALGVYALGVPTPTGKRCWRPNTIRLILTNPAYTGQVYAGRRRVRRAQLRWSALRPVGHHGESATPSPPETWLAVAPIPALVRQDQFDQAQAKLAQNHQFARRHNTAHSYLLRALVSCGVCQLGCVGRWSHPGYTSYCCRGKTHPIQSGRQQRCRARFIPAAQLDELVWGDLCDLLTHPQSLHHALERAHGGHWLPQELQELQELQARREQLRRGRQQLEAQLDRLSEAYLQGVMPLAEYRRRRQTLEQRQNALARQIEQLETQARDHQALVGVVASVDALCQRVQAGLAQATFEQKRHLVELLIDRVIVTNGDVEIRYVIPTTPASEHVRFCYLRTDYFQVEAPHVGAPGAIQIGDGPQILGRVPPEPERLRLAGVLGQATDLNEQERSWDKGSATARIALGVLPLGLGMQPGPRTHAHRAILLILDSKVIGRDGPSLGRITDKLVTMAAWSSGVRLGGGLRVETAPGAKAHQNSGAGVTQRLSELNGIVASIEEEPGQRIFPRQVRDKGGDLLGSHRIDILLGTQALHAHRRRPTLASEADLGDPGIGPTCDDGLPCGVARGVIVERTPRTRFGVAARPDAGIDRIERLTSRQGMLGKQGLQAWHADPPSAQRVIETAPATSMLRLDAEQWERGDGAGREQGVTQLKQSVSSTPKGRIGGGTNGDQRGKMSGVHASQSVTLRHSPEAPHSPLRG